MAYISDGAWGLKQGTISDWPCILRESAEVWLTLCL